MLKTAYDMRMSDWSSDVFSSYLGAYHLNLPRHGRLRDRHRQRHAAADVFGGPFHRHAPFGRRQLVDLCREPEDRDAVGAVGDAGVDLPPHRSAVQPAVAVEQRVEDRIDAVRGHGAAGSGVAEGERWTARSAARTSMVPPMTKN